MKEIVENLWMDKPEFFNIAVERIHPDALNMYSRLFFPSKLNLFINEAMNTPSLQYKNIYRENILIKSMKNKMIKS